VKRTKSDKIKSISETGGGVDDTPDLTEEKNSFSNWW